MTFNEFLLYAALIPAVLIVWLTAALLFMFLYHEFWRS